MIPDLMLCFMFGFSMSHVSFKFSCVFSCVPVVSLVPSWFSPLCFSPPRYHTWSPPSSLSSPVPRLIISVCVVPALFVRSLYLSAPACSQFPLVCVFQFLHFDLNFGFNLYFALFPLHFVVLLLCLSSPFCLFLGSWFSLRIKLIFCLLHFLPPEFKLHLGPTHIPSSFPL